MHPYSSITNFAAVASIEISFLTTFVRTRESQHSMIPFEPPNE